MRVLHVAEIIQGGLVTYLDTILPAQAADTGITHLSLLGPSEHLGKLTQTQSANVVIHEYERRGRDLFSLLRLLRAYRGVLNAESPDLVHVHCTFAGLLCRLFLPKVPIVYCPHGWSHDREMDGARANLFAWIERVLARRSQKIIAISEYEKISGVRIGIPAEKIQVIRLGLAACEQSPGSAEAESRSGPLRLLFLGRFDRQKGLDWLLQTLREMRVDEVQLLVAGAAVTDGQCIPDQVPANTHLRGWLSPCEVDAQIAYADAVIVPSRWEGFGLVVIEALRLGVPALVSERGALPEVVGDGEGGLVFPFGDSEGLRQLLRNLTREQLRQYGRQGKARFAQNFSQKRMRDETMSLYQSVVSHANAER